MAGNGRCQRFAWLTLGAVLLAGPTDARAVRTGGQPTPAAVRTGEVYPSSPEPPPGARVRGLLVGKRDAAALLEHARVACPTVRRLLEALEHTDVIVLVEVRDRVLNRTAHLTFVSARHGTRWLRITVDGGNHEVQQAAWLAHELQHAMEVAAAPDVQDLEAMRRLFARIGTGLGDGQFETDAAVAAGKQALLEAYR